MSVFLYESCFKSKIYSGLGLCAPEERKCVCVLQCECAYCVVIPSYTVLSKWLYVFSSITTTTQ